jgi:Flp pilus assembly protein protease CpaA
MDKIIFLLGCLIPVTVCGYTDFKTGYIYNKVTLPMILAGICYSIYASQLKEALLGLALGFLILLNNVQHPLSDLIATKKREADLTSHSR